MTILAVLLALGIAVAVITRWFVSVAAGQAEREAWLDEREKALDERETSVRFWGRRAPGPYDWDGPDGGGDAA